MPTRRRCRSSSINSPTRSAMTSTYHVRRSSRMAHRARSASARKDNADLAALLQPRAQSGRAPMALPQGALPLAPPAMITMPSSMPLAPLGTGLSPRSDASPRSASTPGSKRSFHRCTGIRLQPGAGTGKNLQLVLLMGDALCGCAPSLSCTRSPALASRPASRKTASSHGA
jgi:hypothetical protein